MRFFDDSELAQMEQHPNERANEIGRRPPFFPGITGKKVGEPEYRELPGIKGGETGDVHRSA